MTTYCHNHIDNQVTIQARIKMALKFISAFVICDFIHTFTLKFFRKGILIHLNTMNTNEHKVNNSGLLNIIQKELDGIGEFFVNRSDFFPSIGLYGGEAGTVLFLAQFYLKTRDERYLFKLRVYLDKMIELCNEGANIPIFPYFSNGLAGFGWLLCYLKENGIVDFSDDYLTDIDNLLQDQLKSIDVASWDLLHGRLGIVRYFFKRRNNIELIGNELEIMKKQAVTVDDEYKWVFKKLDGSQASYDMGLAHGMAGILYFVGKSYEMGIKKDLCLELGDGILRFYHHQQQNFSETGSYYVNFIPVESYKRNYKGYKSRLAWCYGDLGILYSIYLYCLRTGNYSELENVRKKLLVAADRRDCKSNEVYDAMLCHGSSGLVQIYTRLYMLSKDERFNDSANYWLDVSTRISRDSAYTPPYKFVVSREKGSDGTKKMVWSESLSLLEGVMGVGLAFLSILDHDHMNWDEILMLH